MKLAEGMKDCMNRTNWFGKERRKPFTDSFFLINFMLVIVGKQCTVNVSTQDRTTSWLKDKYQVNFTLNSQDKKSLYFQSNMTYSAMCVEGIQDIVIHTDVCEVIQHTVVVDSTYKKITQNLSLKKWKSCLFI